MGEILVKHKLKKRIKEEMRTSYPTVRLALAGVSTSPLCLRIREKALELGGVEVTN